MAFTNFLLSQSYRADCVGDLARDAVADTNRPTKSIRQWRNYLKSVRASMWARDALEKAWQEYRIAIVLILTKS
jgi:hypothetical protein